MTRYSWASVSPTNYLVLKERIGGGWSTLARTTGKAAESLARDLARDLNELEEKRAQDAPHD